MSEANDYRITTVGQLRTLMGLPGELTPKKVWAEPRRDRDQLH